MSSLKFVNIKVDGIKIMTTNSLILRRILIRFNSCITGQIDNNFERGLVYNQIH